MKYDLKELKKALEAAEKSGGTGTIDVQIDPMERLIITYSDRHAEDEVKITLFQSIADAPSRMAIITKTSRL